MLKTQGRERMQRCGLDEPLLPVLGLLGLGKTVLGEPTACLSQHAQRGPFSGTAQGGALQVAVGRR